MTCCADKYFAKKVVGGPEPERPALHTTAGSPDGYHSAREPSDFDNDTEEELQDVESEEEPMVKSDNSNTSSVQSGRASLHSQRSTMENRDWKRAQGKLKATDSLRSTNAKKGIKGQTPDGKKSKVVLSMFQDSQKEYEGCFRKYAVNPSGELYRLQSWVTSYIPQLITKTKAPVPEVEHFI